MYRLSDEQLIAMCAHGRRDAMDVLVSRHHSRLLDFVCRQVRNRELAGDIVQSAFIRVFEGAASYRIKASFKTWMYTITLNLIKDEYRKRSVRPEALLNDTSDIENTRVVDEEAVSPEDSAINSVRNTRMWQAIDGLPESQKTAIILRFRQGMTYDEIADVMHAPCGTVKSWVHHGLRALRQSLGSVVCED